MTTANLPEAITSRYDVADQIGAGGQGIVYRATDRASGQAVAVKLLHHRFDDPAARQQFEREVATLQRLHGVPGVITIAGHGVADQRGWLATELFPSTLADRLRSFGRLDATEVRDLGATLASALAEVHEAGVLHRDLKPSNVFLSADGSPVLGDFGVARIVDERTLTSSRGASLGYVAPEVIEQGATSQASDLYGLGATLYALLEGHPPHADSTTVEEVPIGVLIRRIAEGAPVEFTAPVPDGLAALVRRLLAHDPKDRPRSAAEVSIAFREGPDSSTSDRERGGLPQVLTAVVLAAVALTTAVVVATRDRGVDPASAAPATAASAPLQTSPQDAAGFDGSPDSECNLNLPQSAIVLCETFDAIDGWDVLEAVETASITVRDGRVVFAPSQDAVAGPSHIERRLGALPPSRDVHVRVNLQLTGGPLPEDGGATQFTRGQAEAWWQNLFGLRDESSNTWNAGVQWGPNGYLMDLGFADPPDTFGGEVGLPVSLERSSCVALRLGRADDERPSLSVNGQNYVQIADPLARDYGDGYVVRVGPIWLDPRPGAPTLEVDELVVATQPIDC